MAALLLVLACSSNTPSPTVTRRTPGASDVPSASASSDESVGPAESPIDGGSPSVSPSAGEPSGQPTPAPTAVPSGGPTAPPGTWVIPAWSPWPAKNPGSPSVVVAQGRANKKLIALTIDDAGNPRVCREEFKWLDQHHIPATWFPTANNARRDPRLWRQIAAAGYPIGNHTTSHTTLTRASDQVIRYQLTSARRTIEAITKQPMLPVFRPPGGAYNANVLVVAGQAGFHTALIWSNTFADTALRSKPSDMVKTALRGGNGTILLSHCNTQTSADIMPTIVQGYLDRGFTFVTVPDLLRPSHLGG